MAEKKKPKGKGKAWRKEQQKKAAPKPAEKKVRRSKLAKHNPIVDMTNWRRDMQTAKVKFDDEAKGIFLEHFAKSSLKKRSADAAGVHLVTVNAHLEVDPDFAMAYNEALEAYRDFFVEHGVKKLAYEGIPIKAVNPYTGDVYEQRREYAIPIVSMELKRVDHSYREKAEVSVGITGGVLVISEKQTPEDWVADQRIKNEERTNPMLDDPFSRAKGGQPISDGAKRGPEAEVKEVKLRNRAEEVAERNGNGKKAGRTVVGG